MAVESKWALLFVFLSAAMGRFFVQACNLWGHDTGYCSELPLDPLWRMENLPWCQYAILYPACLPKEQTLPPSREFPDGRWFNHTTITKDRWVQTYYKERLGERLRLERNKTLRAKGINEYGENIVIRQRFNRNPPCRKAFKMLWCWLNFPRCNMVRDITLGTCVSACENYFISCGFDKSIWRCGSPRFFNGYSPESPSYDVFGEPHYLRDYFPGQPFRENQFNKKGLEIPICTPSIDGAAYNHSIRLSVTVALMLSIPLLLFLL